MKITIFGHSGFIGSNYVNKFKNIDQLYLPDRNERNPSENSEEILNFISTTHNYHVFDNSTLDIETNLILLMEMLNMWKNTCPQATFSLISSWFVYGDGGYTDGYSVQPANELSPCNPQGFYSITKYTAEQLLISYAKTFGLRYRILRLCNIIGPGDAGVSKKKNALQYLINEMKEDRDIELYENGDFYRTYMDVDDCARALRVVMQDGDMNTVYNIGGTSYKFSELVNYAHEKIGSKSKIVPIEQKSFHKQVQTKSFKMDTTKLKTLGFAEKYSAQTTIDRIIK